MSIIVWRVLARGDVLMWMRYLDMTGRCHGLSRTRKSVEMQLHLIVVNRHAVPPSLWFIYEALRGFLATRCGQKSKLRPGSRR